MHMCTCSSRVAVPWTAVSKGCKFGQGFRNSIMRLLPSCMPFMVK
jgi:hypothetical protein